MTIITIRLKKLNGDVHLHRTIHQSSSWLFNLFCK